MPHLLYLEVLSSEHPCPEIFFDGIDVILKRSCTEQSENKQGGIIKRKHIFVTPDNRVRTGLYYLCYLYAAPRLYTYSRRGTSTKLAVSGRSDVHMHEAAGLPQSLHSRTTTAGVLRIISSSYSSKF